MLFDGEASNGERRESGRGLERRVLSKTTPSAKSVAEIDLSGSPTSTQFIPPGISSSMGVRPSRGVFADGTHSFSIRLAISLKDEGSDSSLDDEKPDSTPREYASETGTVHIDSEGSVTPFEPSLEMGVSITSAEVPRFDVVGDAHRSSGPVASQACLEESTAGRELESVSSARFVSFCTIGPGLYSATERPNESPISPSRFCSCFAETGPSFVNLFPDSRWGAGALSEAPEAQIGSVTVSPSDGAE
jgi:hypothetical protein